MGSLEKRSAVLGRDAVWTKTSRICRLPPVLCVQMMRFFWKSTPQSQDHAGINCKMLRVCTKVLDAATGRRVVIVVTYCVHAAGCLPC